MTSFVKQKQIHRHREQIYGGLGDGGKRYLGFGMHIYTLLYFKWITNKDLLYIAQGTLLNVTW